MSRSPSILLSTKDENELERFVIGTLRDHSIRSKEYAIVFDIDETLMIEHPKKENLFRANTPVVAMYREAQRLGYAIYLITARPKSTDGLKYTTKQLDKLNLKDHETIYFKNKIYEADASSSRFKRDARRRIFEKHGKKVLLNIGDQWSDHLLCPPFGKNPFSRRSKNVFYVIQDPDDAFMSVKLKNTYVVD